MQILVLMIKYCTVVAGYFDAFAVSAWWKPSRNIINVCVTLSRCVYNMGSVILCSEALLLSVFLVRALNMIQLQIQLFKALQISAFTLASLSTNNEVISSVSSFHLCFYFWGTLHDDFIHIIGCPDLKITFV